MEAESLVNGVTIGRTLAVLALVVGLILVISWFLRRNGVARSYSRNNKLKRLAVLETRSIDNQRRLILIERDNVQHLLLVGGQNDLVIETNISHKSDSDTDPMERVHFRDRLAEAESTSPTSPPMHHAPGAAGHKPGTMLTPGQRIEPTEEDGE